MYGSMQVYFLNIKQYIRYCMPYDGIAASQQDLFFFLSISLTIQVYCLKRLFTLREYINFYFMIQIAFSLGEGLSIHNCNIFQHFQRLIKIADKSKQLFYS